MVATKKSQPRGRPRGFDPDAAIETAQQLFQEKGYDGVGVADIGKALGITPPSFYNAFGSKAALFGKVLERYAGGFGRFVPEALAGQGGAAEAVDRILRDAARLYAKRDGVAGCLVLDGARGSGDAEAQALTARMIDESRAMIAARIAVEEPGRADLLATVVTTALKGMSAAARDGASEAELRAFADMAAAGFRAMLSRP
ncbi:TetR/AcrR family transcriptional regulator [Rhizorhabdus dicambivorans]|uniref:TetR/AcrR family transcriptional regulator n=1 Tax=Rhizorhabdus dicambivorans TaxID=1850238 RepID=A0A2A4FY41_9SPHN|nr:TetR/AcrR family transcriptional regulator [Rhizorhabdus dicambivorans]ATE63326.1 TetR/AcrR family transcriptional regulator [Rhizorhabdus dicambivorans]PCE43704.1 TetR/AcrR family transcriptional regulator [Rhizorhabdus dicambivorans]